MMLPTSHHTQKLYRAEHERNEESIVSAETETYTRLHGRWLLIARLAWTAVFTVLTVMYALGFLAVREALSTVGEEQLCTLRQQIRQTDTGAQLKGWPGPSVGQEAAHMCWYAYPLANSIEALRVLIADLYNP